MAQTTPVNPNLEVILNGGRPAWLVSEACLQKLQLPDQVTAVKYKQNASAFIVRRDDLKTQEAIQVALKERVPKLGTVLGYLQPFGKSGRTAEYTHHVRWYAKQLKTYPELLFGELVDPKTLPQEALDEKLQRLQACFNKQNVVVHYSMKTAAF